MARRRGLVRILAQTQRQAQLELQRKQAALRREQARIQMQAARAAEQARKNYERALVAQQKERARLYAESRQAHVTLQNEQLEQQIESLEHLLLDSLTIDPFINVQSLKQPLALSVFNPGPLGVPERPPQWYMYVPAEPKGIQKLLPGTKAKHAQSVIKAQETYQAHINAHAARESSRQQALAQMKADYDRQIIAERQRIAVQHAEIDAFERDLQAGLPQAIVKYFTMILASSVYPDKFPRKVKLTYSPETKQLVVEYGLPDFEVIPAINSYKYIKAKDSIIETARSQAQRKSLYTSIIAQITLRTLSELFKADRMKCLDTIMFNGYVESTNKGIEQSMRTCLVIVHTSREAFTGLNLKQVTPQTCLTILNASVSKNPSELIPVRPVSEFSMGNPHLQGHSTVENKEQSPFISMSVPLAPAVRPKPEIRRRFEQPLVQRDTNTLAQPALFNARPKLAPSPIPHSIELNQKKIAKLHEESEQLQERLTVEDEEEQLPFPSGPVSASVAPTGSTGQLDFQMQIQAGGGGRTIEAAAQMGLPVEKVARIEQRKDMPASLKSEIVRGYEKIEFESIKAFPSPTMRPPVRLNQEAIAKLREESEQLQARLIVEAEEQEQPHVPSALTPISATPATGVITGSALEVDEDWQSILQQWQPEHWEIIRLLYQEQSAQLVTVERKVHRPISRIIDEINAPVDEQLGDLLIDPETQTLSPHLQAIAESLVRWYFSSIDR